MLKRFFEQVRNPLIEDTLSARWRQWKCDHFGCIRVGSYYRMPQAWCRRCGHINKGIAADFVSEWNIPD